MAKKRMTGIVPALVVLAFSAQATAQSVSITKTSQGRPAGSISRPPVQTFYTDPNYQILTANDLGMHCGDLDSRIAMILPPFNTVHAQVIRRSGQKPTILDKSTVRVMYSSTYQSKDPALANAPVTATDGSIFKSNFWETAVQAYSPFYPAGVLQTYLPQVLTGDHMSRDIGLPVPNVERIYLGDGVVEAAYDARHYQVNSWVQWSSGFGSNGAIQGKRAPAMQNSIYEFSVLQELCLRLRCKQRKVVRSRGHPDGFVRR